MFLRMRTNLQDITNIDSVYPFQCLLAQSQNYLECSISDPNIYKSGDKKGIWKLKKKMQSQFLEQPSNKI